MNETLRKEDIKIKHRFRNSGNQLGHNEDTVDAWTKELSAQIIGYATNILKEYGHKRDQLTKEYLIVISKGIVFCFLVILEKEILNFASKGRLFPIENIKKEFSDSLYKVFFQKDVSKGGYEYFKSLFDQGYMAFRETFIKDKKVTLDKVLKELLNNEFEMVFSKDQLIELEKELTSFFEKNLIPQLYSLSSL